MKSHFDNLIEITGISEILPEHSNYFKQFQIQEIYCIPAEKPDIEQILSVSANVEIIETTIISTPEGKSCEGQILGGKKLLVRGKLLQKIEYTADCPTQPVHAAEFEKLFSNYIVLDEDIDCSQPMHVDTYIENIYIKQLNNREIFKNIMLLINAIPPICDFPKLSSGNSCEDNLEYRYQISKHHPDKCKVKKYFTQFVCSENLNVPEEKPDIEHIISTIVDPKIISLKVIDTLKGISTEGQFLSGKKIVAELKIKQKILYAANVKKQSVHGMENEFYQSVYVVVPELIEGTDPETLLKSNLLQTKLTVEDVFAVPMDKRSIFKNITLLLEICSVPTYEVCYSCYSNCTHSHLSIMYEDGKCNHIIPEEEDKKELKPLWSPNGQYTAYLSCFRGKCMLSLVNVKSFAKCEITNPEIFDTISSYCWSADGKKIFFSGVKNNSKDIYSIDITSLKWVQLTNGNGSIKSYKPQCSSDGNKIAFLRSISNIPNLWVSEINGFNSRQVSSCGYIKDFDWLDDGKRLIFAAGKGNSPDELFIVDIDTMDTKKLLSSDCIYMKKCIKVSPDKNYIAFIGTRYDENCISKINNIYVYEFKSKCIINVTRNIFDTKISDLAWKIDSSKIYYSSNELGYYNVYSISLNDFCKDQLTNLEASNIELSYRPRIK